MGRRHNQDYFKVGGSETGGRDETGQSRARYSSEAARLKRGGPPTPVKPQGRTPKPGHRPGQDAERTHERAERATRAAREGKAEQARRASGRVEAPRGETSARAAPVPPPPERPAARPAAALATARERAPRPVAVLPVRTPASLRLLQQASQGLRGAGRGLVRFTVGMALAPLVVGRLVWRVRQV